MRVLSTVCRSAADVGSVPPSDAAWTSRQGAGARPPRRRAQDDEQEVAALDLLLTPIARRSTVPPAGAGDVGLHLHRLDRGDDAAGLDAVALGDVGVTTPAKGAGTCRGVGRVRLLRGLDVDGDRAVAHLDRPELSVERAHDGAHALAVGVADRGDARGAGACRPRSRPRTRRPARARGGTRWSRAPTGRRSVSRLSSNSLVGPGKSSWLRVRRGSPCAGPPPARPSAR